MPKGARRVQDARRKEVGRNARSVVVTGAQVALEALYEFCLRTNRKRRPRRESPDFKVVEKVMEWWLGDEWRGATFEKQERHLRSATQWQNQRVKRARHRLVDDSLLESRLSLLLQMTTSPETRVAVPQFRGSARDWAASLGIPPTNPASGETHAHSLKCGHTPVKVISEGGATSLGFVVSRATCCAASGSLLCDAHSGTNSDGGGVPPLHCPAVSHGDHIDYVIDGHLTHPTNERDDFGELKWADCGELIELDQDTIADMYNILA